MAAVAASEGIDDAVLFIEDQIETGLICNYAAGGASSEENSQRSFNELNRAIRREVTRLSERWNALISQADRWQAKLDDVLPKIHTFQKGLEAVMQRLVEAERAQTALSNTSMARMNNGGTATESEILLFRNQLKVGKRAKMLKTGK